jgi:hypothetical protein
MFFIEPSREIDLLRFGNHFFLGLHIHPPELKRIRAASTVIVILDHVAAGQTQRRTIIAIAIIPPHGQEP